MKKWIMKKQQKRRRRAFRVRKSLCGTAFRPRLCVVKSNKHLQAQLIDDDDGRTLGYVSTCAKDLRGQEHGKKSKASAKVLGERIAKIAQEQNIKEVIFDRGHHKYHGVLAALADAAREGGLKF